MLVWTRNFVTLLRVTGQGPARERVHSTVGTSPDVMIFPGLGTSATVSARYPDRRCESLPGQRKSVMQGPFWLVVEAS